MWNTTIPHILWFTYKHNILATKEPAHYHENVKRTVSKYEKALELVSGQSNWKVLLMDDNECVKIIEQAMKVSAFMNQGRKGFNLKSHFLLESDGSFKSDICRTVALYLHGGYCFDVDMEVVEPIVGINGQQGLMSIVI